MECSPESLPALRDPTRQLRGLLDPTRQLPLVHFVSLMDVEVAHFFLLGLDRGDWTQRRAAEESHFDVFRQAMVTEKPALAFDAIKGCVPPHGLAYVGHGALDEIVEETPDIVFPTRHGRDVSLHRCVAIAFGDLRVAA